MTRSPNVAPAASRDDYDELIDRCSEQFSRYLQRLLGHAAEGRGGRIGVEDTLQDALVRIYREWPTLGRLEDDERESHVYRCLRSAATDALRREHGGLARRSTRPRTIPYDFAALDVPDEERPVRERELTAAVLGGLAGELGAADASSTALRRAVLVAGLAALTEHEAVVVIAVDHLGWDQRRLAEQLDVSFTTLRDTLRVARKLLSMTIRHAAGIEVDDEEQAQLAAFRAGELKGAERRAVARHLARCQACQTLDAERRAFGHHAAHVLAPLPFVAGAHVLVKNSVVKSAPVAVAGTGLFAQAGSAKVAAAVTSLLVAGGATAAILALATAPTTHLRPGTTTAAPASVAAWPPPTGMRRTEPTEPTKSSPRVHPPKTKHKSARSKPPKEAPSVTTTQRPTVTTSSSPPPAQQRPTPSGSSNGASCEFFCG